MQISQTLLYVHENQKRYFFLKVPLFVIKDAKNHRNRLNSCCQKIQFKNITKHTKNFTNVTRILMLKVKARS